MADINDVLSWLEWLTFDDWRYYHSDSEVQTIAKAAMDLLIKQEPVAPGREFSGSGVTWWNVCGNCRTAINPNDKFCHECGRAVKWE